MNDFTHYRQEQADFLKKELTSSEFKAADKRILIHHIPLFGKNLDKYNPCKDLWEPILTNAKFNIFLNAHTHEFEYIPKGTDQNSYPVMIGGGPNEKNGVVTILEKNGNNLTLTAINVKGQEVLKLDL